MKRKQILFTAPGIAEYRENEVKDLAPDEAPEVFARLANDHVNFPLGVLFDWTNEE